MSLQGRLSMLGLDFNAGGAQFSVPVTAQAGMDSPVGQGDVYYLDPVDGDDDYSGKTPGTAKKTLAAAEDLLTANQNDTLRYLCSTSGITLTANFEWDKDYTHFVGVCPPTKVSQRARIFGSDTAGTLTKLFKLSGNNCQFSNLYLFHGGTHASDVGLFEVTGERNVFVGVHFAGGGHATPAAQTGMYSLKLNAAAECLFYDCTIGLDTITRGAANAEIQFAAAAARIMFDKCRIISQSDTAGHVAMNIAAAGADRWIWLHDTIIYNFSVNHATTLTCCVTDSCVTTHDIMVTGCSGFKGYGYWAGAGVPIYTTVPAPNTAGGEAVATATS